MFSGIDLYICYEVLFGNQQVKEEGILINEKVVDL